MMDDLELSLDFYDDGASATWCWKVGLWSSQEFGSEFLARRALQMGELVFSQLDQYDPYEAAVIGAWANFGAVEPFEYWVIDKKWLREPMLGGKLIGSVTDCPAPAGSKVLHISQDQFDLMLDTASI